MTAENKAAWFDLSNTDMTFLTSWHVSSALKGSQNNSFYKLHVYRNNIWVFPGKDRDKFVLKNPK